MTIAYKLTPNQIAALRALNEAVVELSPLEVAVKARLQPNQARSVLAALEQLGLVNSWVPVTGRTGEYLYVLAGEAQLICRALEPFKGAPPTGTIISLARELPIFSGFFPGQSPPSYLEIIPDQ